ncbi:MAG: circularly permuted type 2 ATP-grasp protein, partial [Gammaproteobacteria bacterium]|nr:circularly permuted type 2 ATP-grasp protein [Gammaproteobacteria bacterium]
MPPERMATIQERVTRSFTNEGISFTLYDEDEATERIIPIDAIPRVVPQNEWVTIEAGLKQRVNALNRFLHDVYHDASIVKEGVIPVEIVKSCPQYRLEMHRVTTPNNAYV